jgi:hypothetical protein
VEHYVRAADTWVYKATTDLASEVQLPSIDCTLPMAEVYDQIVFPSDAEAPDPVQGGDPGTE